MEGRLVLGLHVLQQRNLVFDSILLADDAFDPEALHLFNISDGLSLLLQFEYKCVDVLDVTIKLFEVITEVDVPLEHSLGDSADLCEFLVEELDSLPEGLGAELELEGKESFGVGLGDVEWFDLDVVEEAFPHLYGVLLFLLSGPAVAEVEDEVLALPIAHFGLLSYLGERVMGDLCVLGRGRGVGLCLIFGYFFDGFFCDVGEDLVGVDRFKEVHYII